MLLQILKINLFYENHHMFWLFLSLCVAASTKQKFNFLSTQVRSCRGEIVRRTTNRIHIYCGHTWYYPIACINEPLLSASWTRIRVISGWDRLLYSCWARSTGEERLSSVVLAVMSQSGFINKAFTTWMNPLSTATCRGASPFLFLAFTSTESTSKSRSTTSKWPLWIFKIIAWIIFPLVFRF